MTLDGRMRYGINLDMWSVEVSHSIKSTANSSGKRVNSPLESAFENVSSFIESVIRHETTSGIVLLISTFMAVIAMNTAIAPYYTAFIDTQIGVRIGGWDLTESLKLWVNDGLMTIFFLLVGLEIKRELLYGELSSVKKAALPVIAAAGGMAGPALIYMFVNPDYPAFAGWGVPVATDIAFAMSVLAVAGKRAPRSLYVFLVALAIVDDVGAIMVIAIFYTKSVSGSFLLKALAVWLVMVALNAIGVKRMLPYYVLIFFMWLAMLKAGIHATLVGVLAAMTIPSIGRGTEHERGVIGLTEPFNEAEISRNIAHAPDAEYASIQAMKKRVFLLESPLNKAILDIRVPVAFIVIPVFAFVNAGVPVSPSMLGSALSNPVAIGVILGLFIGKFIGITSSSLLAIRMGIANLPDGMRNGHLAVAGFFGGIGFTMSIFIASLAFREDETLLTIAKSGVLTGSIISGLMGFAVIHFLSRRENSNEIGGNDILSDKHSSSG